MEVPFHASALMLEAPNTTQDILIRLRRGQFWRQTRAFFQCFLVKKKKKKGDTDKQLIYLGCVYFVFLSPSVSNSEIITEKKIRFVWQLYHKGLHFISKVLCTGYSELICSFLQQRCPFYCL